MDFCHIGSLLRAFFVSYDFSVVALFVFKLYFLKGYLYGDV